MAQEFEQVDQTELPYSLEAEQTILGSIFVDASVLSVVLERIKPDSFFNEQHKALFQIIMQMFTSGEKIDIVTVLNAAMAGHIFDTAAEGRAYLGALVDLVPSVANVESYCKIVEEKYYIRSLAFAAVPSYRTSKQGNKVHKCCWMQRSNVFLRFGRGKIHRAW